MGVNCDGLIKDEKSSSDAKLTMKSSAPRATVEHEAGVSKIGEEPPSRGLSEADDTVLSMEYAVESSRLLKARSASLAGRALDHEANGRETGIAAASP